MVFQPVATKREQQEFRFGLGHLALEFLATLANRFGDPLERLGTPGDLECWLEQTEIASGARCDDGLLAEGQMLREAISRVLEAIEQPEKSLGSQRYAILVDNSAIEPCGVERLTKVVPPVSKLEAGFVVIQQLEPDKSRLPGEKHLVWRQAREPLDTPAQQAQVGVGVFRFHSEAKPRVWWSSR